MAKRTFLLVSICALLGSVALRAETVSMRPVADTTLFESAPDDNMGGWTHVASGTTGNQGGRTRNRALLRFDPTAAIPARARVTNAFLVLQVTKVPGNSGGGGPVSSTFALHSMLRAWGEGEKLGDRGFPADVGEATWNSRFAPDESWGVPGGEAGVDFSADASATNRVLGKGPYQFGPTAGLLADVQAWLDNPAANAGWALLSQSEGSGKTARGFASREDPALAPVLVVEFAPPAPFRIQGSEVHTNGFALWFLPEQGRSYAVEFKDDFAQPTWTVLTNLAPAPDTAVLRISTSVNPPRRFFRVSSPK